MKPLKNSPAVFSCALISTCLLASIAWAGPVQVLKLGEKAEVSSLAFAPDGKTLAISVHAFQKGGFVDAGVELWDLPSAKQIRTLHQKAWYENDDTQTGVYVVGSLQFSPGGRLLAATDGQGYVLWDTVTGAEKFRWWSGVSDQGLSPGWSADGKWLALPSMEKERFSLTNGIAVLETATGNRVAFFPVEIGYARSARISPDGRLLATAGHDCTVRVFDLRTRTKVFEDFVQTTMFAAAFSPNGGQLIAGSGGGGVLLLYDVVSRDGAPAVTKKGTSGATGEEIHRIEFTPDGTRAISTSNAGVRVWDTKNWSRSSTPMAGYTARLSADGTRVAVVRQNAPNVVEIWRVGDLPDVK